MKKYEYVNIEYSAKGVVFSYVEKHREVGANGCIRKIDLVFEK